jgi:hypothetical protein
VCLACQNSIGTPFSEFKKKIVLEHMFIIGTPFLHDISMYYGVKKALEDIKKHKIHNNKVKKFTTIDVRLEIKVVQYYTNVSA